MAKLYKIKIQFFGRKFSKLNSLKHNFLVPLKNLHFFNYYTFKILIFTCFANLQIMYKDIKKFKKKARYEFSNIKLVLKRFQLLKKVIFHIIGSFYVSAGQNTTLSFTKFS